MKELRTGVIVFLKERMLCYICQRAYMVDRLGVARGQDENPDGVSAAADGVGGGKARMSSKSIDFTTITACGERCTDCPKKRGGLCQGCIEADGYVPEWAESGRCRVHDCTRRHGVSFCGLCAEFPCKQITSLIHWKPDIVEQMTALAGQYLEQRAEQERQSAILDALNQQYPLQIDSLTFLGDSGCITYAAHAKEQDYFLRITKPAFLETIETSLDVHLFLQKQGFPVPHLLFTKDGRYAGEYSEKDKSSRLLLCKFIEGTEPEPEEDAEALGALIGRLHQIMKDYPGSLVKRDRDYYLDRYIRIMRKKGYAGTDRFRVYGEALWERVKGLPYGYCHGDLYPGNLLKSKEGKLYVLDFDTSCKGFPMYDVALLCNRTDYFQLEPDGYIKSKAVYERFLPEYLRYQEFIKEEQTAFYDLIALYHFALQATIIEVFGMDCVDDAFFDRQWRWLKEWERQTSDFKK